uniref:RING-type domain-containing protein n=1 Tax=Macrostomum lignano TaxID=282301 RepID=A0A1I8JR10_9PLAT
HLIVCLCYPIKSGEAYAYEADVPEHTSGSVFPKLPTGRDVISLLRARSRSEISLKFARQWPTGDGGRIGLLLGISRPPDARATQSVVVRARAIVTGAARRALVRVPSIIARPGRDRDRDRKRRTADRDRDSRKRKRSRSRDRHRDKDKDKDRDRIARRARARAGRTTKSRSRSRSRGGKRRHRHRSRDHAIADRDRNRDRDRKRDRGKRRRSKRDSCAKQLKRLRTKLARRKGSSRKSRSSSKAQAESEGRSYGSANDSSMADDAIANQPDVAAAAAPRQSGPACLIISSRSAVEFITAGIRYLLTSLASSSWLTTVNNDNEDQPTDAIYPRARAVLLLSNAALLFGYLTEQVDRHRLEHVLAGVRLCCQIDHPIDEEANGRVGLRYWASQALSHGVTLDVFLQFNQSRVDSDGHSSMCFGNSAAPSPYLGAVSIPPPPPRRHPASNHVDPRLCPMCKRPRRNPCALTTSGHVFCFACIHSHLAGNGSAGKCPTGPKLKFADVQVPLAVLKYIDEGRNPQLYTRHCLETALQRNEEVKGKIEEC